ncbi:MAG TPA: hypothetical protein VNT60_06000, partial [Deinococcales bacterium]|nr:hypothetical protein [Deinococcales bacterium]
VYLAAGTPAALDLARHLATGAGFELRAGKLSGNLLTGVVVTDAHVVGQGLEVWAERLRVQAALLPALTGKIRLDLSASGADVTVDPGAFPQPTQGGQASPVHLDGLALERTTLRLRGQALNVPDVRARVLSHIPTPGAGTNGKLELTLATAQGSGRVAARYSLPDGPLLERYKFDLEGEVDATVARFWYEGVRGGRIRARYRVTEAGVEGDGVVRDGVLEPLPGVLVTGINGPARHGADGVISADLTGRGLDGPVEAQIRVDTAGERWEARGTLRPSLAAALAEFETGVRGGGQAVVSVSGGGWEHFELSGKLSAAGTVENIPVRGVNGTWRYDDRTGLRVDATGTAVALGEAFAVTAAVTELAGDVRLDATARGEVLERPASARVRGRGQGRISDLVVDATLLDGSLAGSARISPDGLIRAAGDYARLRVPGTDGRLAGSLTLTGHGGSLAAESRYRLAGLSLPTSSDSYEGSASARQRPDGSFALNGNLGPLSVAGSDRNGRFTLEPLDLEPAGRLSASGTYDTADGLSLSGTAAAERLSSGGVSLPDLRGPLTLATANGTDLLWETGPARLRLRGDNLTATLYGLSADLSGVAARASGSFQYDLARRWLTGEGRVSSGELGSLAVAGRGRSVALSGPLAYGKLIAQVEGSLSLATGDAEARATFRARNGAALRGTASGSLRAGKPALRADVRSGEASLLNASLAGERITARGSLDLPALIAFLGSDPGSVAGSAALDLTGRLDGGRLALRGKAASRGLTAGPVNLEDQNGTLDVTLADRPGAVWRTPTATAALDGDRLDFDLRGLAATASGQPLRATGRFRTDSSLSSLAGSARISPDG